MRLIARVHKRQNIHQPGRTKYIEEKHMMLSSGPRMIDLLKNERIWNGMGKVNLKSCET